MRRRAFAALPIVLSLLAAPAAAQPATPADAAAVAACIGAAEDKGLFPGACIGLLADPCIAKADNVIETQKACIARELAVWHDVLRKALAAVKAGGFKPIDAAVAASQKGFAASRDGLCAVFDKIDPGTLPGNGAYCRLQETARRTLLLRRLGGALGEH